MHCSKKDENITLSKEANTDWDCVAVVFWKETTQGGFEHPAFILL
jgi:hypothetical protein